MAIQKRSKIVRRSIVIMVPYAEHSRQSLLDLLVAFRCPSGEGAPAGETWGCGTDRGWLGWADQLAKSGRQWLHQKSLNRRSMAPVTPTQRFLAAGHSAGFVPLTVALGR
jgi:hypothetical protein